MRDDELLRRYLLGGLSGEDEALLEARLIQDEDLFESAEAMEADLLDEYAQGGLSAIQRAHMRRRLASSPASRLQLSVIRGLGAIAQEETPDRRILTGPWGRVDTSRPRTRALAAAAMLVMGVGAVWLALQTPSIPEIRAQKTAHRAEEILPQPRRVPPARPAETPSPEVIARAEPAPEPLPTAPTARVATTAPAPFAFTLALTALRGPESPTELHIPAGTEQVDIHLPLSREDEASPSFLVVLRNEVGAELIRRTDLRPVKAGESADLVLPVDAKLLPAGRYSVDVFGESEDNPLGFPEFQVVEP